MSNFRLRISPRTPLAAATAAAIAITLSVALIALSCSGRPVAAGDLVVTSFSPSDKTLEPGHAVQLQFDRPVVAEDQVGRPVEPGWIALDPAVDVNAYWRDRQTLIVIPQGALRGATRYRVALTGELAARTGGFSFAFVHRPLVVEGVWGVDVDALPVRPALPLHFNQPVRALDVSTHCWLRTPGGSDRTALVAAPDGDASDSDAKRMSADSFRIRVRPVTELLRDARYELVCEGISGEAGNAPLAEPYVLALRTLPKFTARVSDPIGDDVPADEVEITVAFSTPVDLDQVRRHITATPPIPRLDQGWLDGHGTEYKVSVNLTPRTRYELEVAGGAKPPAMPGTAPQTMTDRHGQPLAAAVAHAFTTGDARPKLSLETGIYAVEPGADGYPVWTRNVQSFDLSCARVPTSRVVALLTSGMDYDPWYDAGSDQALDWRKLGLTRKQTRVHVKAPPNAWRLERLALDELCGHAGARAARAGDRRGVFLADIRSDDIKPDPDHAWRYRPHKRVLANVTDLGVLLKAGVGSGLVWVARLSDGQPVAGARVRLYAPSGRRVYVGRTDRDGILRTPGTGKLLAQRGASERRDVEDEGWDEYDSYRSQRMIGIVERGGETAIIDGNWANGIQTWNFGVREDRRGGVTRVRGFIQSDRGIYRPGETVHFKGLVREIAVGRAPRVPRGAKAEVQVEDSRGQAVLDRAAPISAFGGFAFDLPLTAEASVGDYYVTATLRGQSFRERFVVEEFRKVAYEVELTGGGRHGGRHGALGEQLAIDVSTRYLFGAPVAGGEVEWTVQRRAHRVQFAGHDEYAFADRAARGDSWWYGWYDDGGAYPEFVSDGAGKTDAAGRLAITVRDPQTEHDGPQDYLVHVKVTDAGDQPVSAQRVITAHKTDLYLGLHPQEFVQAAGMPFSVGTVALAPDGTRKSARATLSFVREKRVCKHTGGYRSYPECETEHELALSREIAIPASGSSAERIFPKQPGTYIVRLAGTDSRGREVVASSYVWVLGKGEAFWSGDESARMGLVASKREYRPGEVARIVPQAGLTRPTALVTIERDGVLEARVVRMASAADGIEIPIRDAHAPNVFASIAMVSGRTGEGDRNRPRFKLGMTELVVSPEAQRLAVEVIADKPSYQPGERVSGVIRVKSRAGAPVRAEVSLSVADEGVLQLIAYKTPDPMQAFYASFGLGVDSATTWNRIARLNDPNAGDPDEGGDSGGGDDAPVRSRFVSSAYWRSSLVTDARGEVRFSFAAPDDLTAFRMMAVAADTGSRFGSGEGEFTVAVPLLARPLLPRFLSAGDRAEVGVMIHNYTGAAGTATVTAQATGATLSEAARRVALEPGGSARVRFPATAGGGDEASFEFRVAMSGHRDAVQVAIPINRPRIVEHAVIASGVLGGAGANAIDIPVAWQPSVIAGESVLTVSVDRTGLGELEPGLRHLIEYPYGCLEQTLSRFIPLTKVRDLADSMGIDALEGPRLDKFIAAGAAKVARHQHADGQFSLWPSGPTYPHLTVYALYGLDEARRAGVRVPDSAIERGLTALQRWSADAAAKLEPGGESATLAMAAHVMASLGKPDPGLNARLFAARAGMPTYGRAFLVRAMKRAGADARDIETLVSELAAAVVHERDPSKSGAVAAAFVRETAPDLDYYMSSDTRSTAMVLSALIEVAPKHALIDELVAGLNRRRLAGGAWESTQDNLYALVALSDYARQKRAGSAAVTLTLGEAKPRTRRVRGTDTIVERRTLAELVAAAAPGTTIRLAATGEARYSVRLTTARKDERAAAADNGFAVTRSWLDPATGAPLAGTRLRAGQQVLVRVAVTTASARRYVAVVDPLPAGLEPVNTRLATSAQASRRRSRRNSWRDPYYGWTHTELRDDRVLGFIDHMRPGTMTLEYLARATTAGTFAAPGAHAEAMYEPQTSGRSAVGQVVVTP